MKTDTTKGFRDITGKDAQKRAEIRKIIEEVYKLYGFEPAETPVIEYEEFVKGENKEDEAVSDIFKLQDKGKRKLALRYEFTFQLKRLAKNKKLPYKRYEIGYVFRDEPIRQARFRQFIQCDADIVGSTLKDEAENLKIIQTILDKLKIKSITYINNKKLLNEILNKEKIKKKQEVIREIDKLDKLPEKEVRQNLKKYNAESLINIFKKPEKYFEKYDSYNEIKELKKLCNTYGVKPTFMPTLARGLSYYNGTILEIKSKEIKQTVAAGGSYPINGMQATGISFGMAALELLATLDSSLDKRVLIISIKQDKSAIKLAEELRKQGIACNIMFDKVSKALEFANTKEIPNVIFVGAEEVKKKKFKIRDMKTGKEKLISENQLVKEISRP
jgi:histidyl-tRNA synthetase